MGISAETAAKYVNDNFVNDLPHRTAKSKFARKI